ncbi:MAG: WecB/TagA/CpsF family glycosyltransferase [Lautropia sp.]|nr:WecB/TagA/CpsF family glycosyltransferase [Lautropia sp.]
MNTPPVPTTRLFHQDVSLLLFDDVADRCISWVKAHREDETRPPALVFAMNPEKSVQSWHDPKIRALLQKANILIPDGIGTAIASLVLNGVRMHRVPGSDLMPALCERAEREGLSIYVYGASPESNAGALETIRRRWPKLRIAGSSHGFMAPGTVADLERLDDPELADSVPARIKAARPDIVFVGLGSPRQEQWMAEIGSHLPVGLFQGVGGTIDVLSGTALRAPAFYRKIGLEWLYRLVRQPHRWRRQLALPKFMGLLIKERLLPSGSKRS